VEAENGSNSDSFVLQNISLSNNLTPIVSTVRNKVTADRGEGHDCDYCKTFMNLGTAICPNCGNLLNLRLHIERIENVL
jgi:rRNA maturation endonuclease Nob1